MEAAQSSNHVVEGRPAVRASAKSTPQFASSQHREDSARSFNHGARDYEDIRPGYPARVAELLAGYHTVVDLGAGTGKLTESLANPEVIALEPSAAMCEVLVQRLSMRVIRATAEATALASHSVDAVACAQAWHWVDPDAASAELDRIIRPHGSLVLAWNTIDVHAEDWTLRLTRIMHSGDVQREGFFPTVAQPWVLEHTERLSWTQQLRAHQLHQLMHTRSYWLRSNEKVRHKMTHNLNWYLYEHLGFEPDQIIDVPYRTDAFKYSRR